MNHMNDVLAKFVLGSEERKHITIDFINSMLEREGDDAVVDITFENSELLPILDDGKLMRLDIFGTLNSGESIDIEIQIINYHNTERRILCYWAQMYLLSLNKGEDYVRLAPAISINVLAYKFLPGDDPHSMYGIYNPQTMHRLTDDLELHFFELPKYQKKPLAEMTRMDRWLAYFANKLTKEEAKRMNAQAIQDAFDVINRLKQDKGAYWKYVSREMSIRDYRHGLNYARQEGEAKGRAEGRAEGEAKGKEEVALEMLKDNMPIATVAKLTKLPIETLDRLQGTIHD